MVVAYLVGQVQRRLVLAGLLCGSAPAVFAVRRQAIGRVALHCPSAVPSAQAPLAWVKTSESNTAPAVSTASSRSVLVGRDLHAEEVVARLAGGEGRRSTAALAAACCSAGCPRASCSIFVSNASGIFVVMQQKSRTAISASPPPPRAGRERLRGRVRALRGDSL